MSTRCIKRKHLLFLSAALAVTIWPSLSKAENASVVSWTSTTPLFIASSAYPNINAYDSAAAAASTTPGAFVPTSAAALTYTGTLDLTNNVLVVQADNQTDALAAYKNIYNMVASGYAGGTYTGTGITSSQAAADQLNLAQMGIMVELNDNSPVDPVATPMDPNDPGYSTFDGVPVNADSILIVYGFQGDTFLQNFISIDEVQTAYAGYENHSSGSQNGEIEYNGVISIDDVQTEYADYQNQNLEYGAGGYPPPPYGTTEVAGVGGGAIGVPEPASGMILIVAIAAAGLGLAFRKSRRAFRLAEEEHAV